MSKVSLRPVFKPDGKKAGLYFAVPAGASPDWPSIAHKGNFQDTGSRNGAFLHGALEALRRRVEDGEKAFLIVPMNAMALGDGRGAVPITDAARSFEARLRGMVALELFGFPAAPRLDTVEDCLIPMMPFFERFIGRPHRNCDDYTVFANCNMIGVGVDLEAEEPRDLAEFADHARRRRLVTFVHGLSTAEQAASARAIGPAGMDGAFFPG
jgi:hypothetical protein